MRMRGFSAVLVLAPFIALLVTSYVTGSDNAPAVPTPVTAPDTGADARQADLAPAVAARARVLIVAPPVLRRTVALPNPRANPMRARLLDAESRISAFRVAPAPAPVASPPPSPTPAPALQAAVQPAPAQPAVTELARLPIPERIYAPTIRLDTSIVPVGWKEVKLPNGDTASEWIVASYQAGWHKTSAMPGQGGNIVLAGHNNMEGEVFRHIEYLEPGDPIFVYAAGSEYKYRVTERFPVREEGVSEEQRRENAKWIGEFPEERLTLISCWPYSGSTHRMFVIAHPWQ